MSGCRDSLKHTLGFIKRKATEGGNLIAKVAKTSLLLFLLLPLPCRAGDIDPLIEALSSGSITLRLEAIKRIEDKGTLAVPSLIEAIERRKTRGLTSEENQQLRVTSCILLGKTRDKRALSPLLKALKDEDKFVREASLLGISYLGEKKVIPELKNFLRDPSGNIRMRAALALARLNDRSGYLPALNAIKEDDVCAQFLATDVLGELRAEEAIPILQSYIDNPESLSWTRVHAMLAIAKIKSSLLRKKERLSFFDDTLSKHKQLEVCQWITEELARLILEDDPLSKEAILILKRAAEEYPFPGGYSAYKRLLMLQRLGRIEEER